MMFCVYSAGAVCSLVQLVLARVYNGMIKLIESIIQSIKQDTNSGINVCMKALNSLQPVRDFIFLVLK